MRSAIYARVSTFDQEPENQLAEIRRYVAARGWTAVEYVDRGVSVILAGNTPGRSDNSSSNECGRRRQSAPNVAAQPRMVSGDPPGGCRTCADAHS
jgi:Resolvase, N terminal domain